MTIQVYKNFVPIANGIVGSRWYVVGSARILATSTTYYILPTTYSPVETKCEIAKIYFSECYSPIPQVIVVLISLFKRDDNGNKTKMRETGWSPIYCRR